MTCDSRIQTKALIQEQLSSPELKDYIDYAPRQVCGDRHQRVWSDFMTGNCVKMGALGRP